MLEHSGDGAFQEESEKERKKVCVRRINKTKQKFDFFQTVVDPQLYFWKLSGSFPHFSPGIRDPACSYHFSKASFFSLCRL